MPETPPNLSNFQMDEDNPKEEIESIESYHPKSNLESEENLQEGSKEQEILDKKSSLKKRGGPLGINSIIKDLQAKWKGIFEFDPKMPLTIKGKKKKLTKQRLIDFFSDLHLKMNEHGVKNLGYFSLDLTGYSALIEGGLISLSESLSTPVLKDLHHLNLNLDHANVSDQEIQELLTQIATNLHQLEHLHLNFNGCYKMQPQTFENINLELIPKLQNLKSLSLKINLPKTLNKNFTSNLLSCIADNLTNTLQNLDLDISGYNIHPEDSNNKAPVAASKLTTLTSFILCLNGWKQVIDTTQGFSLSKLDSGFGTPIA